MTTATSAKPAFLIIQDASLRVEFGIPTNPQLVQLTDLNNGMAWTAEAPARLEVLCLGGQRPEVIHHPPCRLTQGDGFVDCELVSTDYGVKVVVRFTLEQGELVVRIPSDRISETNREVGLLSGIELLPGLLSTSKDTPGHLVLPIRNGVICRPERHQRFSDRFLIYGEQKRWEDLPLLPCCGAVREKAHAALLAIVAAGDCDAECRVSVDGQAGGKTGFALRYRYTPIDPVDPIDRVIHIVPLRGKDAGYAGMGRRMYRHILKTAGRGTLAERAAKNPDLRYAATSYTVKVFQAHKAMGFVDGTGEYKVWATFDQTAEQLAFLKKNGIERVWAQCVGWNPDGHDGAWPTRFPIDERLGGAEGFKRLIAAGKTLGYMVGVHDNYLDNYKRSPDWDPDLCVGNIYGQPLKQGVWSGGQNHRGWGLALPDRLLKDQLLKMKELGIEGVYYIDAMAMPLEVSYNPKHGERRYRRACAEGQVRILREAEDIFGGSATEMGFLYCAAYTDSMATQLYPCDKVNYPIADEAVPLWNMAMKGLIFYESGMTHGAIFNGNPTEAMARHLLGLAETGVKPRVETSYVVPAWGAYPVEAYIDGMQAAHDLMLKRLEGTCMASLDDHEFVAGDPASGKYVSRSKFSDGTEVVCDYEKLTLEIDGKPYRLPEIAAGRKWQPVGTRPAAYSK
jgi:hypothetical protein